MKFDEFKLEQVLESIFSGGTPSTQKKNYWDGEFSWLSSGETRNNVIRETEKKISEEGIKNSSTKLAQIGDIVMASAGQGYTRGQTSILCIDTYINQSVIALRANEEILDNKYLYYNLSSRYKELRALSDSSSIRGSITTKMLKQLNIKIPKIKYQKKVVNILWNLDSKIELNNQIISNLEELASTLFKRWFVDFEFPDENGNPYKSSGGKMVDSELGEIPEGWKIIDLKSIVDVVDNRGKTPPLEKDKTDFPIIDVKTLSGNGRVVNYSKAQKYVSEETYSSWFRSGHPKINDILISTVGSIGEIKMFLTDKGTIAQNVVGLRAKNHLEYYLYQFLLYNKSNLITYNIGSVQPSIKVTHLLKYKLLLPSKKDLNKFNSVMIGLTDKIINLSKGVNSLTEIRDSLLPKLLSGEIELPEDEGV
ncbi:restriction endonuclease subunit S [Enterococcus casseliflavus]|uniref:restriction endonuclease subunit S n=1 Tax=Enterococcus casseliflavus TaxID=37734 RepID=UPI0037CC8A59